MKFFTLLPLLCLASDFDPYRTAVIVNNHAFTALASKIDQLRIRHDVLRFHYACWAGFETRERCFQFYHFMQLYAQSLGLKLSQK